MRAIPILAVLAAFLCAAQPAKAALHVCNKTAHPVSVALGYFSGSAWSSAGWWRIAAGGCARLIQEPLVARYYYLYAIHEEVGGDWDGDHSFCVNEKGSFVIEGRNGCVKKGFVAKRFFQVDTGQMDEWTQNLSD